MRAKERSEGGSHRPNQQPNDDDARDEIHDQKELRDLEVERLVASRRPLRAL